jgi:hypothetical protein
MLKVGVVARDPQIRVTDLIFYEVTGHHIRLHVADSSVPKCVHTTRSNSEAFA